MSLPIGLPPSLIEFRDEAGRVTKVQARSGRLARVSVTSTSSAPRTLTFKATKIGNLEGGSGDGLIITNGQIVANVATGKLTAAETPCTTTPSTP